MSEEDYDAIAHRVLADWEAKQAREAAEKAREDDRRVLSRIAGLPFWTVVYLWVLAGMPVVSWFWIRSNGHSPEFILIPTFVFLLLAVLFTLQYKALAPLAREVARLHAEIAELKSRPRESEAQ